MRSSRCQGAQRGVPRSVVRGHSSPVFQCTGGPGPASQPPPSAAVYRCSGGLRRRGAPFVARRALILHGGALTSLRPPPAAATPATKDPGRDKLRRAEWQRAGASVCPPGPPVSGAPFRKRPCTERVDAPRPGGALPRRTLGGTMREGNEAGGDAAALECRHLREWWSGGRRAPVPGRGNASGHRRERRA